MINRHSSNYMEKKYTSAKSMGFVRTSSNSERDSFKAIKALLQKCFKAFLVNLNKEGNIILGQSCYANLSSIDESRNV